jgi:hypothetical protein
MSKKEKAWKEKEVDEIQPMYESEEKDVDSTQTIKIYWPKIVLLGFLSSAVFTTINVVLILIFYFGLGTDILVIMYFMQYVFFGEAGIVIFIGACLGNFGQSTLVSNLKERFIGSDPISKDTIREATFNSFSYYFGGGFLVFYGLLSWQILRLVVLI